MQPTAPKRQALPIKGQRVMNERPDPDQLLAYARREEAKRRRGRLKIFLSYAAGVGKTYAMLEAARQRMEQGVDVVAGYVETHGRAETEMLLEDIESLPRREVSYRHITLTEMNLDGLLARKPEIALVDELAHTNAPGSRHRKRYNDVLELLDAGIDVYTTMNVQHLESLNDVVTHITEAPVPETVPDRMFDEADEIELVDLPVDELLQRLEEGKIYVPEQAEEAMHRFFRPGNLTALRELALRRAADRVDEQMRSYMRSHGIRSTWPATERLLVCIGPSPLSERLVRTARRLAAPLNAEWYAVYVETPDHASLGERERERITRALRLAESLGGKSAMLPGNSVAETIVAFAHSRNATKIIAGKPLQPRWREFLRGSIVDQIIRLSRDIDVYVINAQPLENAAGSQPAQRLRAPAVGSYLRSAGLVLLATLVGRPFRSFIDPTNLVILYLLAVALAALGLGRGPAIVASILSVIAFDLVFVEPLYAFVVEDAQFLITFVGLLGVGLIISSLAARAREQARSAQKRAAHTAVLYELSRDLASAVELPQLMHIVVTHVQQTMSLPTVIFLDAGGHLELQEASAEFDVDEGERAVATWTFEHDEPAGRGTDTLDGADGYYLPLKTTRDVLGVLGVSFAKLKGSEEPLTAEQRRLLESFASQAAVSIERAQLAEKAQEAQLLKESEKLQTALLNSISHDLRTPLASITGTLSSLSDDDERLNPGTRRKLAKNAYEEAERLNRLVGNLLDMTRLEAGALKMKSEPVDIGDVVGVALSQLGSCLAEREVILEIEENLPLVSADFVLLIQVFVNLIENADKYTPPDSPITIRSQAEDEELLVQILDKGPGIPENDLERIFEKFYRAEGTRLAQGDRLPAQVRPGTGLGLSISKGIVEAHQGRIWAENQKEGGAVFTVTLPLKMTVRRPID